MKIYDCFMFYNELDILKLRMDILYNYVDFFVIVEANKTLRGNDKPYYFEQNKLMFSAYLDKIIHVKVDDLPIYDSVGSYSIERFQRDAIMRALVLRCKYDDIILISDVDEIPNPNIFNIGEAKVDFFEPGISLRARIQHNARLLSNIRIKNEKMSELRIVKKIIQYTPLQLEQDCFFYYLNCKEKKKWSAAIMTIYANMLLPNTMRSYAFFHQYPKIKNAGWHFSYMGGAEAIMDKLNSIVEENAVVNYQKKNHNNEEFIKQKILQGEDILEEGRKFKIIDPAEIGLPNINIYMTQFQNLFLV